jgi:hypothetical protein
MRILLIGNFAPPYEEENLHNLSLLNKLQDEGHECSVINISEHSSKDKKFINTKGYVDFVFKLISAAWKKDVVHFSTKGYLRLSLLKLMTSILIGTVYRAKTVVITIHSELFSIQGQMRSPVGGRQTLFTSFTVADRIICADPDTYDVASMYMKKSNFELIPSFIHIPETIRNTDSHIFRRLQDRKKVIVFSNVTCPSFIFEILKELFSNYLLPSDTGIIIALSEKPSSKLQHVLEETNKELAKNMIFIDSDDLTAVMQAYSKSDLIIRTLSCDGKTFFQNFAISVKKTIHTDSRIYFPGGLIFLKEGSMAETCLCIINTLLCIESGPSPKTEIKEDSYKRIKNIYEDR